MNYKYLGRFLLLIFLAIFSAEAADAQKSFNTSSKNPEKALFGKTVRSPRKLKIREPGAVHKAKRRQEKNEKRLKKEYATAIERSRKRTYDIQSPEVQARMKQNQKETAIKNKEKKKQMKAGTKKAGKKYK